MNGNRSVGFRRAVALITCLLAVGVGCSSSRAETVPLKVELRARAVAPGEPVRVVVHAPAKLASLHATFLGESVFMMRAGDPTDEAVAAEVWSGWGMVGLDQTPGPVAVEVRGSTEDGREALGTLAVSVKPKDFPSEELTVAPKFVTPPPEVQERLEKERAKLRQVYVRRTPLPLPSKPFARPVPGDPTSTFGTRRLYNGKPRSPHPGLDLRAAEGTPIHSSGPGRVVVAQDLYYSGNTVIVDHGGGLYTIYAHLSFIQVSEGSEVEQGQVLGLSGATGRVTGPHLHWGAKIGNRPFDPMALVDPALYH